MTISARRTKSIPVSLTYQIEVGPGEHLELPDELIQSVGEGVWLITIRPCGSAEPEAIRDHTSFLSGYVAEDEGLYDDPEAR